MVWSENQYLRTPSEVTSDQVYLRMVGDREITEFKEVQKDKSAEMRSWYKELEESEDSVKGASSSSTTITRASGRVASTNSVVSQDSWNMSSQLRQGVPSGRRASETLARRRNLQAL